MIQKWYSNISSNFHDNIIDDITKYWLFFLFFFFFVCLFINFKNILVEQASMNVIICLQQIQ